MRAKIDGIVLGILFCIFLFTSCGGGTSGGDSPSKEANISVSQTSVDFSGVVLDNYVDRNITIKNTGNANLTIGNITSPPAPFSISSNCSNTTLTPNQSATLMVRFSPITGVSGTQDQGTSTGSFSIPSNDSDSPTINVNLRGDGNGLNVWINQIDTSSCPNISLNVTVTGPSGQITNLDGSTLTLYQNGFPIAMPCAVDGNFTQEPVSVVLALDLSGSLTANAANIKAAAKSFIDLLGDEDEAAICKFGSISEFFPEPTDSPLLITTNTNGKATLKDNIDFNFLYTSSTILYDSVYDSIDRASQGNNKLAVIVLSDGVNTTGENTLQGVIDHAEQLGVSIFSIFYVNLNYYPDATPDIMQQLAINTGGQYYNSGDSDELQNIFEQISYVLNNKYTIEYNPGICTGSIEIVVRAEDPNSDLYGINSVTLTF